MIEKGKPCPNHGEHSWSSRRQVSNLWFSDKIVDKSVPTPDIYTCVCGKELKVIPGTEIGGSMVVLDPWPELDTGKGCPKEKMPDCPNCGEDELGMLWEDRVICYLCGEKFCRENYIPA